MRRVIKIVVTLLIVITSAERGYCQRRAVAINLPLMAVGSYNAELSYLLTERVSLHLPLSWSPHKLSKNLRVKHLTLKGGARWWHWYGYSSLFNGAYLGYSHYNISPDRYRYQGDLLSLAFTIGWSKMVSPRWNVELEGGVAAGYSSYDYFLRERCGRYLGSEKRALLIPSKLSLSILYLF